MIEAFKKINLQFLSLNIPFLKDTAMLENVAILPKFRGEGVIRQLIIHMRKELVERGIQSLFVFPSQNRWHVYTSAVGLKPLVRK
ncbi:hypothetical protein AYJ08_09340 [Brevibacillus sp. SKDU10]|uniref:GNAT family N-acetyltransferase n=1 Tax=Brevibacillus sp. SKDU10 TaxID=1247872 RepID=UPI0007C8C128|nr:hypothetical protein AYJ08_09340 [Brevibacillus sp. SKDU10]